MNVLCTLGEYVNCSIAYLYGGSRIFFFPCIIFLVFNIIYRNYRFGQTTISHVSFRAIDFIDTRTIIVQVSRLNPTHAMSGQTAIVRDYSESFGADRFQWVGMANDHINGQIRGHLYVYYCTSFIRWLVCYRPRNIS